MGLASRIYSGYYRNLGRETFLFPVTWEEGWPIMSPGTGKVEMIYPMPNLPEGKALIPSTCDHFDDEKLDFKWNFLRTQREKFYSLTERPEYFTDFFYSAEGENWSKIGSPLKMKYTLDHFMGYRIGLFNYAATKIGGYVDFAYFHYKKNNVCLG